LCEKSGAIALVLPGLMAGSQSGSQSVSQAVSQSGSQSVRQTDEIVLNLEIFKIIYVPDKAFEFLVCLTNVRFYYRRTNTF